MDNRYKYHLDRGITFHQAGQLDFAATEYALALRRRPDDLAVLSNLAVLYHQRRDLRKAESTYRALLNRRRTPDVLNNFSVFLRESGAFLEALELLREAVRRKPDYMDAQYNLALTLIDLNRFDEAIDALLKRVSGPGAGPDVHANLARALDAVGRTEQALLYGEQALVAKDRDACARFAARGMVPFGSSTEMPSFDPSRPERNVIAFSLWGNGRTYVEGALANVELTSLVYPGWTPRIYLDDTVPQAARDALSARGAQIVVMPRASTHEGLFWRFLVADDPGVDRFLCRDADSRLNTQEAAAVAEWLSSGLPFHIMRDAPFHTELMLAGLWGGVGRGLQGIGEWIRNFRASQAHRWVDQDFLRLEVWPRIRGSALIHDSHYRLFGARPFPDEGRLTAPLHVGAGFRL